MNIPGFTAEATLYKSITSYRPGCFFHGEIGVNVVPQLFNVIYEPWEGGFTWGGIPVLSGGGSGAGGGADRVDILEARCRRACQRFQAGPARQACLDEC
jgi:hypothetical protein